MSGARLWAFLTGCVLVVVPAIAGVYNGATVLGFILMAVTPLTLIAGRRD